MSDVRRSSLTTAVSLHLNCEECMSKSSYKRLLRARFNSLRQHPMTIPDAQALDEILAMPHPNREEAFVAWAARPYEPIPGTVSPQLDQHREH